MPHSGTLLSDRYTLHQRIASGGMGEVWRGSDPVLSRTVAVKLLLPSLVSDAEFITRFRTEARMMASLRHPGIVQVYDYGADALVDDLARDYLVMEYVEGPSLSAKIAAAGRMGVAETLRVVTEAADALQVAHAAGIVHRDVKPSNLLIRPDGTVVLVDFGVARSLDVTGITSANVLVGSPQYMAPEQVTGDPVSPATDIYTLGAVAYCCLTGRPPFTGEKPVQVIAQLLHSEPAALPDDIPAPVSELVLRALSKDPRQRFPTAAALAQAARAAASAAGSAGPATPPQAELVTERVASASAPQPVPALPPPAAPPPAWPLPAPAAPVPPDGPTPGGGWREAAPGPERPAKPPTSRNSKRRSAVLVAVAVAVVAVLIGGTALTTSLVLHPDSDRSQLRSAPTTPASAAAALGSGAGVNPGQAAGATPTPTPTPTPTGARPAAAPTGSRRAPAPGSTPQPTKASGGPSPTPTPRVPVVELDRAVASTAKRGAGSCSAVLAGGYGCFQTYGDVWWVYDTKSDGHSAVMFWEVGTGNAKRAGRCVNSMGVGKTGVCNKDYTEGLTGQAKICIQDSDTKQLWGCTKLFPFTTGT